MILDVAAMLDEMNMGPLELERRVPPVQNGRGAFEIQDPSIMIVDPVIWHTLEGRDLELASESDRPTEVRVFYSKVRFFVSDGGQDSDVIRCEGRRYRFIGKVHDYQTAAGVFFGNAILEDL